MAFRVASSDLHHFHAAVLFFGGYLSKFGGARVHRMAVFGARGVMLRAAGVLLSERLRSPIVLAKIQQEP